MSRELDERVADAVAELAQHASPPPIPAARRREMLQAAVLAGAAEPRRRWGGGRASMAAAAVALLVGGAALGAWSIGSDDEGALTTLSLPTGDRVAATEGSRFRFDRMETTRRQVVLEEGAMVFDVAPIADGGGFAVRTTDVEVSVKGTVFEVRADGDGTAIHVFEGRVEVRHGGRARVLGAGESYAVGDPPPENARITRAGVRAARARRAPSDPGPAPAPPAPVPMVESEPEAEQSATDDEPTADAPTRSAEASADEEQPAELRRMIAAGDAARALLIARRARRASDTPGRYLLIEGDALRALESYEAAALAYDRGARLSAGAARVTAGYRAAALRTLELEDLEGALESLDAAAVDAEGSPLAERGLALRVRCLVGLGWEEAASMRAATYLRRFPNGSMASWMRGVAER